MSEKIQALIDQGKALGNHPTTYEERARIALEVLHLMEIEMANDPPSPDPSTLTKERGEARRELAKRVLRKARERENMACPHERTEAVEGRGVACLDCGQHLTGD